MRTLALTRSHAQLTELLKLGKPRVIALIVFCAVVGMLLAGPTLPAFSLILAATAGIGLVASGAAAFNCLIEVERDSNMRRTEQRPLVKGSVKPSDALIYALLTTALGLWMLGAWVNMLTMWLTLATFFGYAVIYTRLLKGATPQNIVIGGASGAMPPILGWAAVTGSVPAEAMVLFLIIYTWTPPHFWALAIYRRNDYAKAGLPMLPITHGLAFTRLSILLYAAILAAVTALPLAIGMSSWLYGISIVILNTGFLSRAFKLWQEEKEAEGDLIARELFKYSIKYLAYLFAALLLDHWLMVLLA
ncbi:heme o synthase [Iodobacter sp. CM08]|uniref:heme o synthase n=1 Tax=Iodobacter sp. CM08 TaxID=3085902 RepID=UPI0029827E21|nr:heme o synthase [Iodobacter sp. CM08]MDW5417365.1 heme o synthase [Iodobacter sp. CM08]